MWEYEKEKSRMSTRFQPEKLKEGRNCHYLIRETRIGTITGVGEKEG